MQIYRESGYKSELPFQEALIDFAVAAFDIYQESDVPKYFIISKAHKFSVNQIAIILKNSREIFGSDKDSESLVRTAASQVFINHYKSAEEAKTAYDQALKNARIILGNDQDYKFLVRTVALYVFTKIYQSAEEVKFSGIYQSTEEAKIAYNQALRDAHEVFWEDEDSEPLVHTAAGLVFAKKYKSAEEVYTAYDGLVTSAFNACNKERKMSIAAATRWENHCSFRAPSVL